MKKFIKIIMLALLVMFASNATSTTEAFGQLPISKEQMVQDILENQPAKAKGKEKMVQDILGQNREKNRTSVSPAPAAPQISEKGIADRVFKKLSTLLTGKDSETAKAVAGLKTEIQKKDSETTKAVTDLKTEIQKKDSETAKAVAESGNKIIKANNGNTILMLAIVIVGILGIAGLIFFGITSKKNKPVTVADLDKAKTDIIFAINDIPTETVKLSREVDPLPFEFDVAGHHVVYKSPAEGIKEGYYRTLQIVEMPDGSDHPETFERQVEVKRGLTLNYVRGTLKKFLEGKLQGTNEEKLIVYLRDTTKEIKITKIS